MPYDLDRLQGDIAQVQHDDAGFGTGRLVAANLILTAAHVLWRNEVDRKARIPPKINGWKVRLAKQYRSGEWRFSHGHRVVWHDALHDFALIQLCDVEGRPLNPPLFPSLALRIATVERNNSHEVEARGYPQASKERRIGEVEFGPRKLLPAFGRLSAAEAHEPLLLGVDGYDVPDDPHAGWSGMSGSTVLLRDASDTELIWVFGVVQEVPAHFQGQLRVARLAEVWRRNSEFRKLLTVAGVAEQSPEEPPNFPGNSVPAISTSGNTRRDVHYMIGDIGDHFVPRIKEYREAKAAILTGGRTIALTTALQGAGGYGKTTIANALCRDPDIQREFSGGVLRVELSKATRDVSAHVLQLIELLDPGYHRHGATDPSMAADLLAEVIGTRRILLVIDDVWWPDQLSPFSRGGSNCVRLVTTRIPSVLPRDHISIVIDRMTMEEALGVLSGPRAAGVTSVARRQLGSLAATLGFWAQMLAIAGGWITTRVERGEKLETAIEVFKDRLDRRGLSGFEPANETQRVLRCLVWVETASGG